MKVEDWNPFGLNKMQEKKLAELKKAYEACIKANMLPVNIYGSLTFYDKKYISHYGDESDKGRHHDTGYSLELLGNSRTHNSFSIANEFADDSHIIFFTKQGYDLFKNLDND